MIPARPTMIYSHSAHNINDNTIDEKTRDIEIGHITNFDIMAIDNIDHIGTGHIKTDHIKTSRSNTHMIRYNNRDCECDSISCCCVASYIYI